MWSQSDKIIDLLCRCPAVPPWPWSLPRTNSKQADPPLSPLFIPPDDKSSSPSRTNYAEVHRRWKLRGRRIESCSPPKIICCSSSFVSATHVCWSSDGNILTLILDRFTNWACWIIQAKTALHVPAVVFNISLDVFYIYIRHFDECESVIS